MPSQSLSRNHSALVDFPWFSCSVMPWGQEFPFGHLRSACPGWSPLVPFLCPQPALAGQYEELEHPSLSANTAQEKLKHHFVTNIILIPISLTTFYDQSGSNGLQSFQFKAFLVCFIFVFFPFFCQFNYDFKVSAAHV